MELHRLDGFEASGIDHMDITQEPSYAFNGIDDTPEIAYEILNENGDVVLYADAEENIYVIDGLNGFFRKIGRGIKKFTKNIGRKVIKPVVKTFNRFLNPATILLRNGFLLAMKADMMKVARKLRYGYLTEAQARKMHIDMGKFRKLQKAVAKAEKIYELAGGRRKNLKKAILRGKGNKDLKVPLSGFGLGNIDEEPTIYNDPFEKFVVESDIATIEAFLNEEEVNGLGAVASGTAMAAASGAVASVAAVLSKIGNIFGQAKEVKRQAQTLFQKPRSIPRALPQSRTTPSIRSNFPIISTARSTPAIRQSRIVTNKSALPDPEKKSWIERNKTPLLVGAIGLVAAGGVVIAMKSNTKKPSKPVSGLPKKRKSNSRDALGRFTKGHSVKRKRSTKRKTSEKLVAKAIL